MTVPVYIVDLFRTLVEAVSNELNTHVHYEYGHPMEINSKLVELSKVTDADEMPFPIIALFTDIEENRGADSGYYSGTSLQLIIAMNTSADLTAEERMEENFKPILYPIYFNLLRQIARSRFFKETSSEKIIHSKIDRLYWGKSGIYGNNGLVFSDHLDCIEIRNLQLTVKNQICMSEFYTDIFVGNGKSAYQIWLDNGNTGSETDFLNSLVGPPGLGRPRGEYDDKATYNTYDVVSVQKNLALYMCNADGIIGEHPSGLVNWTKLLQFPYGSSSSKGGEKVLGIDPVTGEFVVSNTFMEYLVTNKGIWNAIDTYAKGDFVSVPANLGWYISKVDDNNNVSPVGGNDNWQVVTEIPDGGVVNGYIDEMQSNDIPTFIAIQDYILYSIISNYLAKNLILAPADAWTPRQTNGATWQIDETTTNKQCKGVLVFSPSTEQAIQLELKNLNGELITSANFKVKIHSKISGTEGTGTGVVWGVRGAIITDALDVNWNTDGDYNTTLTQTMTSGSAIYHTAFCTAIKAAASDQLAANSSLLIEIYRKVADAGDDMNASAAILDVEILINQ